VIRRGQATVELALGGLLLVTTVLMGIWLSEVSFLSIKVQEASASAVFNSTGRQVEDFEAPSSSGALFNRAVTDVSKDLSKSYSDFDALGGGGSGTSKVFTHGQALKVECVPSRGLAASKLDYQIPGSTRWFDGTGSTPTQVNDLLRAWYQPRGAAVCTASAEASAYRVPKSFADQSSGGFFTQLREDRTIRLCGAGKVVGAGCPAGYPVLLGDWALDGQPGSKITRDSILPESPNVDVNAGNVPYRSLVRRLFRTSGERYDADGNTPGASGRFAAKLGGQLQPGYERPVDKHTEKKFYMSYSGSEHDYVDMLEPEKRIPDPSCRVCHFNTAGTQQVNGNPRPDDPDDDWRTLRKPCFLGLGTCLKK
jgi:hypothetical protein